MVSLLNGFSQMGKGIASFAGAAGLEQQKSDLEQQQITLANQLKEGTAIKLAGVEGDQQRQTAQTTAEAQGSQSRQTDEFKTTLPMTEAEKATTAAQKEHADAAMLEARKPVSGGYNSSWLVPDSKSPNGWTPITAAGGSASEPAKLDPNSNNLPTQVGLSNGAIALMTGQTQGLRLGQQQVRQFETEIDKWGAERGINTSTLKPQVAGAFKVIEQNITRNNQAQILEHEISGSIDNASALADKVDLGRVNMANVAAVWAGKQVNDQDAVQTADQLNRLREELAGYNAVAGGHLMDNGTPAPSPNDYHAAEATITNGINSGGLKALNESVKMSASKNKAVLQQAIDDANTDYYKLFGANYHPAARSTDQSGGGAAGAADAPPVNPPPAPAKTPALPPGVPSGSQYSATRKQWRDATGKLYNEDGSEAAQ